MRIILFLLLTTFSLSIRAQSPVLPAPKEYNSYGEELKIRKKIGVDTRFYMPWMGYISEMLPMYDIEPYYKDSANQTLLSAKISNELDSNTYALKFDQNGFELTSGSESSQFNGIMTLIQILQTAKGSSRSFKIVDYPDFDWRGIHLDVSRHFFHVDEITRILDLMALYKLNKFHWHLTDDQGWRIEIEKYPLLTEVGAFRDSTLIGHYSDSPQRYDTTVYGGFYTKKDVRSIVEYAKCLNIEVVPEIELPGHSRAALAAYPELSCTGEEQGVPGTWGVFEDIYCSKEASILFLQDVLSEVIELFPSDYVHIGGDEAPKSRWKKCDECQKVISENNLHDEHELQSYFIGRMDQFLTERGKKLIGWDEILEGGLSPNAAVMSWRGESGGIEAAKQGHYAVMTPTTYCYFDYYQSTNENEPTAIGGYLPLEKVYKFNVIPNELVNTEASKYILGGQANLWTEYILDLPHLEYMMFPRAIALAQSVWSKEKPEYADFLNTYLNYHEEMLSALNVNYARSIHSPTLKTVRSEHGIGVHFSGAGSSYLFDVFAKEIGGHTMNGGQVMSEEDTMYFERSTKARNYFFNVGGNGLDYTSRFDLKVHSAIGLPIEFITEPHPKYAHNGSLNLVDGVIGKMPWKGSEWLGFNTEKVEFVVDLLQLTHVDTLDLGLLENKGQWIYFPNQISVLTSKNGKCWKGKIATDKISRNTLISIGRETRYLKIVMESIGEIPEGAQGAGNIPWTFIDELMIR